MSMNTLTTSIRPIGPLLDEATLAWLMQFFEDYAVFALIPLSGYIAMLVSGLLHGIRTSRRDPQRLYTQNQRMALARQAGFQCEHKLPWWFRCQARGREADHVIPWSRGGPTTLPNGQWLCRRHNRAKSNIVPSPIYRWRLARRRRRYHHPRSSS